MSVIELKPHRLSFLISTSGYEDENGDWHAETEEWSQPIECHAVNNGGANQSSYEDGKIFNYSYTIGRLPNDIREFEIGERVKLYLLGEEREFMVKGFQRYQLQSKLWV